MDGVGKCFAGAVALTVAVVSYGALRDQEPAGEATRTKVAEPDTVTGSIASRPIASPANSQSPATAVPSLALAAPSRPPLPRQSAEPGPTCAGGPDALGVSRVVEIDTAGGPGFGFEHFKAHDFLEAGEVVLTFDDGPNPPFTLQVGDILAQRHATATFFLVGKALDASPQTAKVLLAEGNLVGNHSYKHDEWS